MRRQFKAFPEIWKFDCSNRLNSLCLSEPRSAIVIIAFWRENGSQGEITGLGRASGSAIQVLDAMFAHPVSSISSLAKSAGLTPATIGKALEALQNDAQIVREVSGLKRNRMFAYAEYIEILNEEVD